MKTQLQFRTEPSLLASAFAHLHACRADLCTGLVVLAGFGLESPSAHAAVTEAWVHRYNNVLSNSVDQAVKVVRDAAGDVIVTGSTDDGNTGQDMLTIKYSGADGAVIWQKRYNGPANSDDVATALAVDGSGNIVVTGTSRYDYYTAKYAAADGALLWERRYDGPGASDDHPSGVAVDGSGNVVVTGYSYNAITIDEFGIHSDTLAHPAHAAVTEAWVQRYNSLANHNDRANAVAVDGNGNVVVIGYSEGWAEPLYPSIHSRASYTAKYAAANGALLWEQRYNGPAWYDQAQSVAVDASGNVVVTGYSDLEGAYTAKYAAADGGLLWEKHNGGGQAVGVDGSSSIVVAGWGMIKYLANGTGVWTNDNVYATALAVDSGGSVVVTTPYATNSHPACYTAKYAAADGALLWEKSYTANGNAAAVAVDGSGNVAVTGYSGDYPNYDYYTAKYAAEDGALLWEKRYNGPANSGDGAQAVAVDARGNVVVTGYSYGGGSSADYYTAKYAAADGTLLWEKRYDDPANGYDFAQAVAVDGGGNVLVTGYSSNGTNEDYYTAKYAATDGALVWEKRYNGPANGNDYSSSLALGPNGIVAVTGTSSGDYATVVYRENLPPVSGELVLTCINTR